MTHWQHIIRILNHPITYYTHNKTDYYYYIVLNFHFALVKLNT